MEDVGGTVRDRIITIIAAQAQVEPALVRDDSTPESLGLDSLALVEVIFAIEVAYDLQVPFNSNSPDAPDFDITSVGSIVAAVQGLLARRAA
jgi:acyl carrier protein